VGEVVADQEHAQHASDRGLAQRWLQVKLAVEFGVAENSEVGLGLCVDGGSVGIERGDIALETAGGLEILADDVRCTHGATVGQMEEENLFYLMARGLPRREAERLVVDGFFDPILQRIPFEGVRQRLKQAIEAKMG